jgi:hypothetical protein
LAALFHLLRGEGNIGTSLKLRADLEPAHLEYFLEIENTWISLEEMQHTAQSEPIDIRLALESEDLVVDLDIPDVSGEAFDQLWATGVWEERLRRFAEGIDGVLLIVRADSVVPPDLIEVLTGEDEAAEDELPEEEMSPLTQEQLDRIAEGAPTQTKLADLLETFDAIRHPLPVAIGVTAWDVYEPLGIEPDEWLRLNLPLLWQVLAASKENRPSRIFGLSAQGGDISRPDEVKRLAAKLPPATRITVRDGSSTSHDLTRPLTWLLNPHL